MSRHHEGFTTPLRFVFHRGVEAPGLNFRPTQGPGPVRPPSDVCPVSEPLDFLEPNLD